MDPEAFVPAKNRRKRFYSFNSFVQTPVGSPPPVQATPTSQKVSSARKQLAFGNSETGEGHSVYGNGIENGRARGTARGGYKENAASKTKNHNKITPSSSSSSLSTRPSSSSSSTAVSRSADTSVQSCSSCSSSARSSSVNTQTTSNSSALPTKSVWGVPGGRTTGVETTIRVTTQPPQQPTPKPFSPKTTAAPPTKSPPVPLSASSSSSSQQSPQLNPHQQLTPLWLCFTDNPEQYVPEYSQLPQPRRQAQKQPKQQRPRPPKQRHPPEQSVEQPQGKQPIATSESSQPLVLSTTQSDFNTAFIHTHQQQQTPQSQLPQEGEQLHDPQQLKNPQEVGLRPKQVRLREQKQRMVQREKQREFLALLAKFNKKHAPVSRPRAESLALSSGQLPQKNRSLSDVADRPDLMLRPLVEEKQSVKVLPPQSPLRPSIAASPRLGTASASVTSTPLKAQATMQQLLDLKRQQEEQKELEEELEYKLRAQIIKHKRKVKNKLKKERAKQSAKEPPNSPPKVATPSKLRAGAPLWESKEPVGKREARQESLDRVTQLLSATSLDRDPDGRNFLAAARLMTPEKRQSPSRADVEIKGAAASVPTTPLFTPPRQKTRSSAVDVHDAEASGSGFSSSGSSSDYGEAIGVRFRRSASPAERGRVINSTRPARSQSDVALSVSPRKHLVPVPAQPAHAGFTSPSEARLSTTSNSSQHSAHSPSPIKWGFLLRPRSHTESEIDFSLLQLRRSHPPRSPLVALPPFSGSRKSADRPPRVPTAELPTIR